MRHLQILILAALLMVCGSTVSAQYSQSLVPGYNFVTCQVNPGGKNISDPTFLSVPSNFSGGGPGGGPPFANNAELLWWDGDGYTPYFYCIAPDACFWECLPIPEGSYGNAPDFEMFVRKPGEV